MSARCAIPPPPRAHLRGRAAAVALVKRALKSQGQSKVILLVGNRFEGHSPGTINAIVNEVEIDD